MTQLSPASKTALTHFANALLALERILHYAKHLLLKKCPQLITNIQTVFVTLKDLASFLPAALYKALFFLALFSVMLRKFRKWRQARLASVEDKKQQVAAVVREENLENLGPEFIVKSHPNKSTVGNARTEIDSFYLEFQQFEDSKPRDFRDIVFFELMRSYRGVGEQERMEEGN